MRFLRPNSRSVVHLSRLLRTHRFLSSKPALDLEPIRQPSTIRNAAIIAHVDVSLQPLSHFFTFAASLALTFILLHSMASLHSAIKFFAIAPLRFLKIA